IVVYVGTGSRYERDEEAGLSHFIEHMLFKGTERRPTAKEVSEAIERLGGVINAATDREATYYWVKVARPHFEVALDLLTDMFRNSRFDPAEVEKERGVVIEELAMTHDSPQDLVDLLIDEVVWPDQPLGRDVGGSRETVSGFTREMAVDFLRSHYTPRNTVIAVAGNVEHQEVVDLVDRWWDDWRAPEPAGWFPAVDGQTAPRSKVLYKRTEQAHFSLAVPGLSSRDPDRYALDLLNVILGEGMSSRLFLELRERYGLAYDVHSYVSHFLDVGAATIYAGVDPKKIDDALKAVLHELARLREEIPEDELHKAKEYSKGRLLLRMEDTRAVAGWWGGQELLADQVRSVDEVVGLIDRVTPDDILAVARRIFVPDKLNLAVVGPYRSSGRFQKLLTI
ncbi:MAG TPA: pitrilysin family protein, partial [Dehalococcoidia bacterium]|nr:pitrilysin family protein [Dehalococcoidia bacterium]